MARLCCIVPPLVTINIPPVATVMTLGVMANSFSETSAMAGAAAAALSLPGATTLLLLVFDSSMARMPKPIPTKLARRATPAITQTITSHPSRFSPAAVGDGRLLTPLPLSAVLGAGAGLLGIVGAVMQEGSARAVAPRQGRTSGPLGPLVPNCPSRQRRMPVWPRE